MLPPHWVDRLVAPPNRKLARLLSPPLPSVSTSTSSTSTHSPLTFQAPHRHRNRPLFYSTLRTFVMNLLRLNFLALAMVTGVGANTYEDSSYSLRRGSERTLQASAGGSTIDCTYRNSWPSSLTPAQACTSLNDPTHPVPYKCATTGQRLCCSVSNISTATFGSFGKCSKVASSGPAPTPTTPTANPPTRKPTKAPTKKPAPTSTSTANTIACKWFSYFGELTAVQACQKLNDPTHPVPYLCNGRKVCCTVSNYSTATVGGFGTCTKV